MSRISLPVLILCTVSLGEYDFEHQHFPLEHPGGDCDSVDIRGFDLGDMSVAAPVVTAYLPEHVSVPLDQARGYKRSIMGPQGNEYPMLGIEARIVALREKKSDSNIRRLEYGIEVEGTLLFRHNDLSQPIGRLPLIAIPSVDTVGTAPTGPVPVDWDTVSLLLLSGSAVDIDDIDFAAWARQRAYRESSGHPDPWTPFFREQIADDLASGAQPEPELLANFVEWNRARANALPETLTVNTQTATLDWLLERKSPAEGARIFPEPSDNSAFAAVMPRLNLPPEQLFVPGQHDFSAGLAGLGAAEVVFALPAARDQFTVKIDPDAKTGGDYLDVHVDLRVRDIRIDTDENQSPLAALYVEPVKARVTARALGGAEIASATFDSRHPDTEVSDIVAAAPGSAPSGASVSRSAAAFPFNAEAMDLLQLRYLPDTVDDRMIELMMIARHDYEATMAKLGEVPVGAWFFRDPSKPLDGAERTKRLASFREWSQKRAGSLPERLTLTLELRNGVAPFEHPHGGPHAIECQSADARSDAQMATQGSLTEKDAMAAKLCAYLDAAWSAPEPVLFDEGVSEGRGLRYDCGGERYCPEHAVYASNVRQELGLPPPNDLVRLDRLPALDEATRKLEGELVLEIDVAPTGVIPLTARPHTIWRGANRRASPFDDEHGLGIVMEPDETPLSGRWLMVEAKAIAARVVNSETGATVAEPPLAAPGPLPEALLETSGSNVRNLDVLGIRLGMSFEDAERLIREHMEVGRVFKADRAGQIGLASGNLEPYSSGHLFVSRSENEAIAIFDEPPAAPGVVLGVWRRLRLPKGSVDPTALKATLTERYGAPNAIEEVYPTGTSDKGVVFLWRDVKHERQDCGQLSQHAESGRWWRDEAGAPAQPPSFLRHYPVLGSAYHFASAVDGEDKPLSDFCPPILGVWYATYPVLPGSEGMGQFTTGADPQVPQIKQWAEQVAKVAEQMEADRARSESMADEIMTWLNDQRGYARLFFESRRAASAQPAVPANAMPQVKF
ncbi:hypothetical protein MesoLjLb_05550 [Mesorhizobium sp. L-8-3]|nr:hypothetical protein MesoLjLb_05550 [Mesorhizobium sp. L-8-3]